MFNFNNECNNGMCPPATPTYNCCNQVVNKCYVQDIPHYTNYHTTVVNNCVRRHINVPTFTQSEEVVVTDQYVDGSPMYYNQNNMYYNANPYMYQNNMNVGNQGFNTEAMPNMNQTQANPFNF